MTSTGEPGRDEDLRKFRNALGRFPSGVTVVTARSENEEDVGMTISSFASLSLRPPLVLFCIDRRSHGLPVWLEAEAYGISVLAEGQDRLATQFATALEDKWADVPFRRGLGGAPLLEGCAAWFEARRWDRYEGGDHFIFVAEVVRYHLHRAPGPLVFCDGRYNRLRRGAAGPPDWPLPIHY